MTLLEIAFLIASTYCFLMLLDFITVAKKLKAMVSDSKERKGSLKFPYCYTFAGRMLNRLAESMQHKLAVLNWEAENFKQNSLSSNIIDKESQKTGSFYQGILGSLFTKLRVETVYIITMTLDGKNLVEVQESHSRNSWALPKKLSAYLVNFYHSYFRQNDQSLLGLRDGFQSKSLTGEFYLFGYRYVIALPLTYNNHEGTPVRGLLWLGYNKNSEPYANEVNIAREACEKIENEFASQRIIEELSTKVKEEKSISKQRDEFLAHVSHDIRSPLNNIRSIINLMRLESNDKEELELLDTALGNCYDVEEIINTILDYTRFQAGQLTNRTEEFDLNFLAEEVVSNQKVEARLKNISLELKYEQTERMLVNADKKQVKRVLNNLVNNAIKYTRDGSIEVIINGLSENSCSIKVTDTGVGMTDEQLRMLFTPFYRFHPNQADGIGLGLALSKILTELNGGTIKADSAVDHGSVFELIFPCRRHVVAASSERLTAFTPGQVSSVEVLVLDDNAVAVESMSRMLLKLGFNVTKCFTVSDAMSIINYSPPHFLITDWQMPEGGAKRLLNYLKLINSNIRVCVLTGSNDELVKHEISKFAVEKMFCKSDDFEELHNWLGTLQVEAIPKLAKVV